MAQSVGEVALDIVMGKNNVSDVVNEAMNGTKNAMSKGSSSVRQAVDKIDAGIKKAGKIAATSLAAAATSIGAIVESTRDFRVAMGKVDTAFTTSGFSAETGRKTFEDFAAVLGDTDQATEAVNNLAKLATSEQDLTKWTDIATGVYATFGDGLPIEGLTEAANETAKVAKVTGPLADALNWVTTDTDAWNEALGSNKAALAAFQQGVSEGMSAEDAFNEALLACNSEQERSQLITATLTSLYGEAADTYKETNGAVMDANRAQVSLNESMAEVGAAAEPIMTALKQGLADVLKAAMDLMANVDFTQVAASIQAGFGSFIENVLPKIVSGFNWIIEHSEGLKVAIIAVSTAFVALKTALAIQSAVTTIQKLVTTVKAWEIATKAQAVAQAALNAVMAINPVVLIIAAIAALVAIFVVLWNKCEGFREFWKGLWEGIKSVVSTVVNAIKTVVSTVFNAIKTAIETVMNAIKTVIETVWNVIKGIVTTVVGGIATVISTVWNGIKTAITTVVNGIKTVVTGVWNGIKTVTSTVFNGVKSVATTAWNGIKTGISTLANGAKSAVSTAWNGMKSAVSTVGGAILSGVQSAWNSIKSHVSTTAQQVKDGAVNAWNAMKSGLSTAGDAIKSKASSVWSGVKSTVSTMANGAKTAATNAWSNIKSGIQNHSGGIQNAVSNCFSGAKSKIQSFASQAVGWGADFASGLANGIKGAAGKVVEAAQGLGNKIKSLLHFSRPDEGPLRDYETWMPDFISGMTQGIERNKYQLVDAVKDMANEMTIPAVQAPILKNVGSSSATMSSTNASGESDKIYSLLNQLINTMQGGDITIPVYIGNDLIDEQVIRANDRRTLRSGGRA